MVEFEGKIANQTVSILIDPRVSLSYVSPEMVEKMSISEYEI